MIRIGVPSGIGDISWIVSKLVNAPQWPNQIEIVIADGWPFRAQPYLEMLGIRSSYGEFKFDDIISFLNYEDEGVKRLERFKTWEGIVNSGFGCVLIQPNWHLEMGRPLDNYLSDLKTDYHYKLKIPDIRSKKWYNELTNSSSKWIGVSAASYRGAKAWKTWDHDQWVPFCKLLIKDGYSICLIGGAWDDLTSTLEEELGDRCLNLVGKTTFPEACAVHEFCDFYIGFSSGLGIIRSVMGLSTMMLWPEHQQPLSMSWADPEDVASGKYVASQYMDIRPVYNLFKRQEKEYTNG
jgi:hypothetical protein